MENIRWLPVKNYEGYYEVNNLGEVRSVERYVRHEEGGERKMKSCVLKSSITYKGYMRLTLAKDGKNKSFSVHRLVAEAFIVNPNNLPQVNHIDLIKINNQVENLEWCTNRDNRIHSINNRKIR